MSKSKTVVLVVEDEPMQASLIAEYVEAAGPYQALIAHNGVEAFKALKKNRRFLGFAENKIKCILLDIRMPNMDGITFLKRLREEERFNALHRYIPVIVISAYDDSEYWKQTTDPATGMVAGYLVKPFDKNQLDTMLTKILKCGETEFMVDGTLGRSHCKQKEVPDYPGSSPD